MCDRVVDDAVLPIDIGPPPEDAAFLKDDVECDDTRGLGERLKGAADEISKGWRRMRGIIGPF